MILQNAITNLVSFLDNIMVGQLGTEQMNGFLTEKTGLTLEQMKTGIGWIYLAPYDRYYAEHGDTNIRSFFCPGGEVDGGIYRIRCLSDGYSQFNLESIVTLKQPRRAEYSR